MRLIFQFRHLSITLLLCSYCSWIFSLPHHPLSSITPSRISARFPAHLPLKRMDLPTDLGNGWSMHINNIGCFVPFAVAAADLTEFYAGILAEAIMNASLNVEPTRYLHWVYGSISLLLTSVAPIEWDWVIEFVREMVSS